MLWCSDAVRQVQQMQSLLCGDSWQWDEVERKGVRCGWQWSQTADRTTTAAAATQSTTLDAAADFHCHCPLPVSHCAHYVRCLSATTRIMSVACQPLGALCPLPVSHYAHYVRCLSAATRIMFSICPSLLSLVLLLLLLYVTWQMGCRVAGTPHSSIGKVLGHHWLSRWLNVRRRYDTIRDAILTCARKPT